ncbi:glycosyltransferase family 2 protein [Actinoplanes utahensis]|uniref:Glycosyl transferase family 2 n=1 Tax=Actinoplanes utahensis TaxID=1869 RepID=A0A0A6UGD1_ACTUT|nr:glycosyltransferase family 2 protein [Actinoplanes utahensis]KHD73359.1 glycosyl transferase family 2 [Actinoplanes utahensis]GIF30105.1 glycosyl transferase [Actinoplanes utahensis]
MSSVSVVIPCYKYGDYLRACVDSVLDNPGVDVRVLIIDDASPDDSADKARAIAEADPRVEVLVHAENKRHIATYNEGLLEWADGDYTVLLSADDLLTPGALTRAVALLDANPNVGFAYGHPVHFQHPGPPPPARDSGRSTVYNGHWWLERRFREGTGCITSPEVVVRTKLQQQVGGYDPNLPHAADIEMWMRLASHADVGYVRADQAYYRLHAKNMHADAGAIDDLRERKIAYESVLTKCRHLLPDADRLDAMVHQRLARFALRRAFRAYDRGKTAIVPVDELEAFAAEVWPDYRRLTEYRALSVRRRVGARTMPYLQPLVLSAVAAKGREWLWWQSWRRRGI